MNLLWVGTESSHYLLRPLQGAGAAEDSAIPDSHMENLEEVVRYVLVVFGQVVINDGGSRCGEPGRGVPLLHLHGTAAGCPPVSPLLQALLLCLH
ncbi:hypothetical protein MTO96_017093 [Rhipicephalus appendiculatus]